MSVSKDDLRKAASVLVQMRDRNAYLEKRGHATRLLFQQVEQGLTTPPYSHRDFEEKLASLEGQDLKVVEEAMKMKLASNQHLHSFGTLESSDETLGDSGMGNAEKEFMFKVMEE